MDKTERWASILHTILQCMSLLMAHSDAPPQDG